MFECSMAAAVGLLGSPTKVRILTHLARQPLTLAGLHKLMPQSGREILRQELQVLQHENFVSKDKRQQYCLSEFGTNLVPILGVLNKWDGQPPC